MKTGGQTGQWLLLAVLSAALCTSSMADPVCFEPKPAEVSADHKRTTWPDVQEREAGGSGRRRRRRRRTKSPRHAKSPTGSPTILPTGSPTKSPTESPTKSPTLDPCGTAFKPAPPTCPNGYSATAGTFVDKQFKEHGVCIMIQSVLCQCGSSGSGCPKAECKQFKPVLTKPAGTFIGFEVSADTLFTSNFTGWTAIQPTAQNMPKVIRILEHEYENAIQTRAQKIDACATESIEAAKSPAATTTTLLTESRDPWKDRKGLLCCNTPCKCGSGRVLYHIPGSHQWGGHPNSVYSRKSTCPVVLQ